MVSELYDSERDQQRLCGGANRTRMIIAEVLRSEVDEGVSVGTAKAGVLEQVLLLCYRSRVW